MIRVLPAVIASVVLASVGSLSSSCQQARAVPPLGDEVHMDLVVHDKANKPVLDLQPQDISITDSNEAVSLTRLHLVSGKQSDASRILLLFNRPGFDAQQKSSKDFAQQTSKGLKDAAAKFLKTLPENDFQFSVLDVWGRLQAQQEFTSDRKQVMAAIADAVQPGQIGIAVEPNTTEQKLDHVTQSGSDPSGASVDAGTRLQDQALAEAIFQSVAIVNEKQVSANLASLQALAQSGRESGGRTAIVYFTTSPDLIGDSLSPSSEKRTKDAIQSIVGAANRAGLSIYVVRMDEHSGDTGDALNSYANMSAGSSNPSPIAAPSAKGGASNGPNSSGYSMAVAGQFASSSEFRYLASRQSDTTPVPGSLDSLVRGTAGYSFAKDDNFSAPVGELVFDLTTYYEASFVPAAKSADGSFHAVVIKPNRAGLKVRSGVGYSASPATQPARPQ